MSNINNNSGKSKNYKKKTFKNSSKANSINWKISLLRILDCLSYEEATWASQRWGDYGVSQEDQKKIFKEYERYNSRESGVHKSEYKG